MRVSMPKMSSQRKPSSHAASSELIDSGRSTTSKHVIFFGVIETSCCLADRSLPVLGLLRWSEVWLERFLQVRWQLVEVDTLVLDFCTQPVGASERSNSASSKIAG